MKTKLLINWLFQNAFKLGLFLVLSLFLFKSDLSFQLNLNSASGQLINSDNTGQMSLIQSLGELFDNHHDNDSKVVAISQSNNQLASSDDMGNDYSNMTYQNTSKVTANGENQASKKKKQLNYVERFGDVARSEMHKYGIPASIILAQGLIESNAGDSRLSRENHNHFGMKCFSKSCRKGHCSNFTDDSHKDFFRKYETAWESYRAHSILLGGDRYKHLKNLSPSDYKAWSHGLKKAGYATDKRYAEKLIHIIEELELDRFDK